MADLPRTMKAWVAVRAGEPKDVLELRTDWPTPAPPRDGEVMVKVSYAALNPGDLKNMATKLPWKGETVPGMDFVGRVVQVGPSSSASSLKLRVGAVVAGTTSLRSILRGAGVLADYVVVLADLVVEKPEHLIESIAAGLLGVAGQTTATLLSAAGLHEGDRALVNGASGGVGSILTQVLHGMGVHVTAICSAKNVALVQRLGVDETIDYTAHESIYDHISSLAAAPGSRPFDVIIDCVGDDTLYYHSTGYLKSDGKFLSIEAGPFGYFKLQNFLPVILGGTPRTFKSIWSIPSGSSAREAVGYFEKRWVTDIPVDSTFEMGDALQAFEKLATKRTVGKIFVKVN
ncbi:chaperonin 10-like protein [Xylariales sp. PMI_506]|nr:chaperonin 10-like protein [Xylariales sp. PMI_506]